MRRLSIPALTLSKRARSAFALAALAGLVIWLTFFDSHSIARRVRWEGERSRVAAENASLAVQIEELQGKLKEADSDALVEQIAREQYGMRRPGERVYRVQQEAGEKAEE